MPTVSMSAPGVTIGSTEAIVLNLLSALDEERIDSAVEFFSHSFVLHDYALGLVFSDRAGLTDFFSKRRKLFPEVHFHLQSLLVDGDTAVLRWILEGFAAAGSYGQRECKVRVMANRASIVECDSGKIATWSDYYDGPGSMRTSLLTYFKGLDEI